MGEKVENLENVLPAKGNRYAKGNEIQLSLGLAGLFEYVCALFQNRSTTKIYLLSYQNIQNCPPNPFCISLSLVLIIY